MNELNSKTLNELRNNPLARVLMGMFNITDEELNTLDKHLKEEEKEEKKDENETPASNTSYGRDYSENEETDVLDSSDVPELDEDETCIIVNKEELEAILNEWKAAESEVYKLDKEFGINIWDSDSETIYNRYNKIIRLFLESQFGVENADILEDWVFGYEDNNRPSFDDVWKNITKE